MNLFERQLEWMPHRVCGNCGVYREHTVIETDDHVILFLTDRRKIENLEKLFQVGVSFV